MRIVDRFMSHAVIEPGEAYKEANRAWQGVPSIARTKGGRLFVGFMSGGIYEPDPRNNFLLVCSDDNGDSWSEPILAIESVPERRMRVADIELWAAPDGALWSFWVEFPYLEGLAMPTYEQKIDMENDSEYHLLESQAKTYVSICKNPDDDEMIWSEPRFMFPAVMRNKPLVTDSGRWLFPTYIASCRDYYEFYYSDDNGMTVHAANKCFGRAPGRAYDEPSFYRMTDGRIAAVVRTTPPMYKCMISEDDGMNWSEPKDFMETSSQRPCTGNLNDGSILLIPSMHKGRRDGMKLMLSADGKDFADVMLLDESERISYAEFVQDENDTLYIVYDRERNNKIRKSRVTNLSEAAKEILFARIPVKAWQTGTVTSDTVRARIITKAGINELNNIYT